MPNYRRPNTKGATYFVTVVTHRRQRFLCDDVFRQALRTGIQNTQRTHPFTIDAWILLPDHLHCIWTLPPEDASIGARWAMIKRYVTKTCGPALYQNEMMTPSRYKRKESTIWQRRFWEHQIRDDTNYRHHMDYIHFNPVKHNLVTCVKAWPWSTFHRYVQHGVYTKNWGGNGENSLGSGEHFGE